MTTDYADMDWKEIVSKADEGTRGLGGATAEAQRRLVLAIDRLHQSTVWYSRVLAFLTFILALLTGGWFLFSRRHSQLKLRIRQHSPIQPGIA
jgi:hypothetical protein